MPKKQKSKIISRDFTPSSKPANEDPVCACVELDLKPPTSRVSRGGASKDDVNSIDNKYAAVHWSDAYKLDIHDGEPALIVRDIPSSSEFRSGNDDSFIAAICKVRISPAVPTGSTSSTKNGTPLTSKKKSSQDATTCGEIILSPSSLYGYFSPSSADVIQTKPIAANAPGSFTSPPASKATNNASFSSPSKAKFSFSKGGGGDSLISPSPSKFASPSGSKFSFSKGGGGDSLLSPGLTKTPTIQSNKRAQAKVVVVPLINLSPQQLRRLCPDAQTLLICPMNDSSKSNSYLSSSTKIIQTLIMSKYHGSYVQAQSTIERGGLAHTTTNDGLNSTLETISISFRGQMETFHIIDVTPAPIQDRQTNQRDDQNELLTSFDQLDISGNSIDGQPTDAVTQKESQLLKFIQSRLCGQKEEDGKSSSTNSIACRITPQTNIGFVSSLDEVQSTTPPTKLNTQHDNRIHPQAVCAGLDSTLARIKDALLPPLLHPNLFPTDGPLRPPKGALLYGPAGVGKSLLAAQIANALNFAPSDKKVHVRLIQCADILSSTAIVGEGETMLSGIFEEAERKAADSGGSLVILDDVHLICPRRGGMGGGGGGLGVFLLTIRISTQEFFFCPMLQCWPTVRNIPHKYRFLPLPKSAFLPLLYRNNGQAAYTLIVVMVNSSVDEGASSHVVYRPRGLSDAHDVPSSVQDSTSAYINARIAEMLERKKARLCAVDFIIVIVYEVEGGSGSGSAG
eukprot:CAMPEP_0201966380 /NCGR_PEP_ID=MMETSP0904-20121228/11395_1 /ASSEMBLY_ACC=CAM_ASM_000553 /TAXON_ID=420261 /ORGANISM="Thalassiosira antarctica, Strain CCMP982" /LENGTH=737 /DNA_ID=CAMNT_0048513635 /DNA_START=325 /DNA_END=2535 /DNA_ORIENTATION=+